MYSFWIIELPCTLVSWSAVVASSSPLLFPSFAFPLIAATTQGEKETDIRQFEFTNEDTIINLHNYINETDR
jgi:hypothetical protein